MADNQARVFKCAICGHQWDVAYGTDRPEACPSCSGANIHRVSTDGGFGGGRMGAGRCRGYKTGFHRQGRGREVNRCGSGQGEQHRAEGRQGGDQ